MKKNKTMAYSLAALLLVGGTFVGTKALFTDSEQHTGELKISTGSLNISATTTQDWDLDRNGENEKNTGTGNTEGSDSIFDNLKTGDKLTKTVTITNEGTLTAIVDFKENPEAKVELPTGITYTATLKNAAGTEIESDSVQLNPTETATIEFMIEVTGDHSYGDNSLNSKDQEEKIITLSDSYLLSAEQITE